ncbi:insulinase family protein [Geodermatophilus sabuli]|uniref:Insulinase family protein n=1 Tax=Geodermatophilus sabuli TaxID=1564158 RepID=A0A7K3W041_9ACTN|nr:insulinase family protein [Geodermatophilus sabuli]NEK58030.1 insulinase family protein [Geodermatophilus sabuli]
MQRIEIDGVPVISAPGPERITAALVFGVGLRDETFATIEITHLVEHLAMGALPKSHLRCNAVTDVDTTAFYATGRPEAVRAFLEGVCRALSDLPTERLELEVGVLEAENCSTADSTIGALWAARFGLTGPGLVMADGPGRRYLTEDLVRAHARRWFVRGNAALWCSGAVPAGLRLPLPAGPRPERAIPAARPQTGPVWTAGHGSGVGLLLASGGSGDPALMVGVDVLKERLRDTARHARGLSYSVDSLGLDLGPDRREVAVVVDAREGQEGEVADLLWRTSTELAATGPTPAELAHAVAGFEEDLDADPRAVAESELADAAYCAVSGLPFRPVEDVLEGWRAVTPERVATSLAQGLDTAILYVPEGSGYAGPGAPVERRFLCNVTPQLPVGTVFRPPLLTRLVDRGSRVHLVVGDGGLAHRDADGDVHTVPWELVEAAVPTEDGRGVFVVGRNLCAVLVDEDRFGRRAVAAVRARVPAPRWVTAPVAAQAGVPVG